MSSEISQEETMDLLRWTHGILAAVLQEAGGVIEIEEKDLSSVDLSKSQIKVNFDEERKVYIVEGFDREAE